MAQPTTYELIERAIIWINAHDTGDIFRISEMNVFLGIPDTGPRKGNTDPIHRNVISKALKKGAITCVQLHGGKKGQESRYQIVGKL